MKDLQALVTDINKYGVNYVIEWDTANRKYTNFSITTIAANEDSKSFNAWVGAFGSVSIQHCFSGKIIKNDTEETIIEIIKTTIYIRDGFDFSGDKQALGKWENNIFNPQVPSISNSLSNKELNDFRERYGIGKDFRIFLMPISTEKLFNKIIINKKINEITYQK